jgi:alpha-glucosidase
MNRILLFTLFIFSTPFAQGQDVSTYSLHSPNGLVRFALNSKTDGSLFYNVQSGDRTILDKSFLSFKLSGEGHCRFKIIDTRTSSTDATWHPIYGERSTIRDNYEQLEIDLILLSPKPLALTLTCRCYDEGVAFRFTFPRQDDFGHNDNLSENSEFSFTDNFETWAAYRAQAEYKKTPLSDVKPGCERPLVVEMGKDLYVALGEAGLVDFARMKFRVQSKKDFTLVSFLDGDVKMAFPAATPWRYVLIGDSPGQLLERNYFLQNLNEPSRIADTSWIKPGKVIREVTLTTQGGLACVDFCAEHNLQYVEFDAGWYGHEHDVNADASTITVDPKRSPGPLDVHKVIKYGKGKGIGVILYINRRAMEKQLDDVLPIFQQWGVAGLKYGFVRVGSQKWTAWMHDAVRKAAEHELMLDIHDEYRPTGVSRTWPNLMTQEGIRGDEESPSNEHTLITMFTRMIAGAGDNTICYFADRVDNKMGSHASQLAKAVCLYSPWQFLYWYDRPEKSPRKKGGAGAVLNYITNEPELAFFDNVSTVWDESRVIEGEIGRFGTIARRSGDEWFVGCINGAESHNFSFKLDFLKPNKEYELVLYSDDAALNTRTMVHIEHYRVDAGTTIQEVVLPRNGLAMHLLPSQQRNNFPRYEK